MLYGFFLYRAQALAVFVKLAYQALIFLGMGHFVKLFAQNSHILAGLRHALLRSAALHVKLYLADAPGIGLNFIQQREEPF